MEYSNSLLIHGGATLRNFSLPPTGKTSLFLPSSSLHFAVRKMTVPGDAIFSTEDRLLKQAASPTEPSRWVSTTDCVSAPLWWSLSSVRVELMKPNPDVHHVLC